MTTAQPNNKEMKPLLEWLLRQYPDTPKTRAKQWIAAGRVSVHGKTIRLPHQLLPDPAGTLELMDRQATVLECGPDGWQIHPRVTLLHIDAALAVVNKGPGLLSVPAKHDDTSALGILADFLAGDLRANIRGLNGRGYSLPPAYRRLHPLPVHRLDQYTSGVFCMAMNPSARQRLIAQLQTRAMRREYVAYVEGRPTQHQGTWRNWLKLRDDEMRQFVITAAEAKLAGDAAVEAITHYEVMTEFPLTGGAGVVSKLRFKLETGCKHQIRAQAAYAGLPLVGDHVYNRKYRENAPKTSRIDFPRQALHAAVLSLEHPVQPHTRMTWTAALPKDLLKLETLLRTGRI
jgi:23S rRNA pseudouridine1911/1915/1917 synthase